MADQERVLGNHIEFWKLQDTIRNEFMHGNMQKEQYYNIFVESYTKTMQLDKQIMGEKLFYHVFGEAGDHVDELIDREEFFSE